MTVPPDIPIKPLRRSILERFSLVWLIPVAALLIALGVAWQSYSSRGPVIVITFESASGVKAGETVLRYRDVDVGVVEKVGFSPSLEKVDVTVRLDKDIAPFVDADAKFWVVRPEVTTQGVTGLDTVLSGVFIQGLWNTTPSGLVLKHSGLEDAPLLAVGETGLRLTLHALGTAGLSEATPIIYKGIKVGKVGKPRLSGDGTVATADAVIYAPHDKLISSATRFWDTSGFSFKIGAGGAELDFSSLASLISGGVSFETIVSGGAPVQSKAQFDVYPDEVAARASVFSDSNGPTLNVAVVFDENVSGLSAGSPVDYGGVQIGNVKSLRGLVDADKFGDSRVRLLTAIEIRPELMGLDAGTTPEATLDFLIDRVVEGLRARLTTASVLTGGLKIELLQVPNAPPAILERKDGNLPIIPSTQSNVQDVAATAQGVLKRINDLPVEELMASVIGFLEKSSALVGSEDVKNAPGKLIGLIDDARGLVGSDQVQKLPEGVNTLLASLQATIADMRRVIAQIEKADTVNRLVAAIDSANAAALKAGNSFDGVPDLVAQLSSVATKAKELPVEQLIGELTKVAETTNELLSSTGAKELPATLTAALAEVTKVLGELRKGGTVKNANQTLASAASAADALALASADLPKLVDQINKLALQATNTLAGFDKKSEINQDARSALREIQKAAEAVSSLAQALERRPNSLLMGR